MALSKMILSKLVTITKTKWDTMALYQKAGIIPLTEHCENDYAENPKRLGEEGGQ